jgi:ubiquinone/menaquinone biosynthesis C-methylase UbiE
MDESSLTETDLPDLDARRGQILEGAAEIYEEFFVPALFRQWPPQLLDAVGIAPGDRVLDVGCGTGVVARAAAERVGPGDRVVGLDPNTGMLAVARRLAPRIEWRQGPAEEMPFEEASFDAVVCQFALMFFEDRGAAAMEMARVLAPGGALGVATWAAVEESPGYAAMVDLVRRLFGDAPAEALLAPFSIGTEGELSAILAPAFAGVTVSRRSGTAHFESLEAWVHTDIRGWTLSDMIDDDMYERLLTEAGTELVRFTDSAGRVSFPAPALFAVASRPGR